MTKGTTHADENSTDEMAPSEYADARDTEWKKHAALSHGSARFEPWLDLSVSSRTAEDSEAVVELHQSGPEGVMVGISARATVDGADGTLDAVATLSGEQARQLGEELVEAGERAARQK